MFKENEIETELTKKNIKKYVLSCYKKFRKNKKTLVNITLTDYLYELVIDKLPKTRFISLHLNGEDGELMWVYEYCLFIDFQSSNRKYITS